MFSRKFTKEQVAQFKAFLNLKWSFSEIIKYFEQQKVYVSKGYLSKIKNPKENLENQSPNSSRGRKPKITKKQLKWLNRETSKPNPILHNLLAKRLGVTRRTIGYNIKVKLNKNLVSKPKCHFLNEAMIEKRYKRSWSLYQKLKCGKYKNYITSDEAMFYLDNASGQTNVQYVEVGQKATEVQPKQVRHFSKSVMVWAAICSNGKSKLRFVKPGVKINAEYYVNNILKPFLEEDIPKLYPQRNFVFHQDSAPSHRAILTKKFLRSQKVTFLTPEQWLPNSPDCSPCDYFLWGYIKNRLNSRKISTIAGLKKAILREYNNVPQNMIENALKAWPKRCRRIYYARGHHIEKTSFYYRQK